MFAGGSLTDGEDACYTASNKAHIRRHVSNNESSTAASAAETRRDKPKVLMKKKRQKSSNTSSRLSADVVR